MQKTVKFETPEMAERVKEHLHYDVELDGSSLICSKFDRQAFDCAAGLEGLKKTRDYSFVEEDPDPCHGLVFSPSWASTRPSVLLEMTFHLSGYCYEFRLLVDSSERTVTTPIFNEFSLIIDEVSIELATILQNETQHPSVPFIMPIQKASLQVERSNNICRYYLVIMGNGVSRMINFYPTNVCFSVTPERTHTGFSVIFNS